MTSYDLWICNKSFGLPRSHYGIPVLKQFCIFTKFVQERAFAILQVIAQSMIISTQ